MGAIPTELMRLIRIDAQKDMVAALEAILIYAKTMDGLSAPVAAIKDTAHIALANAEPHRCAGCGRIEGDCSRDPCAAVLADRRA